jgi:hypothetical protein
MKDAMVMAGVKKEMAATSTERFKRMMQELLKGNPEIELPSNETAKVERAVFIAISGMHCYGNSTRWVKAVHALLANVQKYGKGGTDGTGGPSAGSPRANDGREQPRYPARY